MKTNINIDIPEKYKDFVKSVVQTESGQEGPYKPLRYTYEIKTVNPIEVDCRHMPYCRDPKLLTFAQEVLRSSPMDVFEYSDYLRRVKDDFDRYMSAVAAGRYKLTCVTNSPCSQFVYSVIEDYID